MRVLRTPLLGHFGVFHLLSPIKKGCPTAVKNCGRNTKIPVQSTEQFGGASVVLPTGNYPDLFKTFSMPPLTSSDVGLACRVTCTHGFPTGCVNNSPEWINNISFYTIDAGYKCTWFNFANCGGDSITTTGPASVNLASTNLTTT
ncbi:hypothetical protein B0H13DRAFT_1915367 [Mycena leptocephala]|nr:hypothetical protein B0H13DRAFT_1915367 [Mycena leptocephala]